MRGISIQFSTGRQRIQNRLADRASRPGAANCLASHLGQFPRGVILFEPLSNRTTEVTVRLRSSMEPTGLAKVTRVYLTNFKRVVEQG